MALSAKGQFTGLMTAVSELIAPPGSLCKADNVVIRKPGAIENRPAFRAITVGYTPPGTLYDSANHGTTTLYWDGTAWRSSAGTQRQYSPDRSSLAATPTKLRADSFSTAFLRGNMYFPHSRGVLKSVAVTDSSWGGSGFTPSNCAINIHSWLTGGTPLPLANNFQWVYRAVPVRTDANGLVIRGRPSGTYVMKNTLGFGVGVQLQIYCANTVGGAAADTVELYRTRQFPNAVIADDEMALVGTVAVPAGGGYVSIVDRVPDAQRGVALYTSPSRGGIEQSHDAPPACAFLETYRGCLFFGNIAGPQRKTISFNFRDCTGSTTGVGYRNVTGNVTNGSAVITAVAPIAGLQVGMIVGSTYADAFRIISIVGTTVTMNSNWTSATAVGAALQVCDTVEVNGVWVNMTNNTYFIFPFNLNFSSTTVSPYHDCGGYLISPPITGKDYTIVIEENRSNGSAFTLRATHGDEFEPPLPLAGVVPAASSEKDTYPNGLIYSEPDQPEHVPPKNFVLVADKKKEILGLCATRDSLFIFKEDGIWRLSGINGEWRIDPFDLTTFCVLPSSIKRLDNAIYMLANKGVVRVSELGVELLSAAIQDMAASLVDNAQSNFTSLGYYKLTGLDGCSATVDARNNEYLLRVGTNTLKSGGHVLVYNARTDAWTTFSASATGTQGYVIAGLGTSASGAPLFLHTGGARGAYYGTVTVGGDASYSVSDGTDSVTVTSAVSGSSGVSTLTFTPAVSLQVGDVVVLSGQATYPVTFIGSTTVVEVAVPSTIAAPVPGAGTFWRSTVCTVQPHGFTSPTFTGKQWVHVLIAFTRFLGPVKATINYASSAPLVREGSQIKSEDEPFYVYTGYAMYMLGSLFRQVVPRGHARSWLLRPTLRWTIPFGDTVLDTIAVESHDYAGTKDQTHATSES